MNTRIKYKFEGPIGISRQSFRVEGKNVRIVVNKDEFYFEIVDEEGLTVLKGGKTKNYNVLLRQAKRALVNMGCMFDVESRDRDYGIVKKDSTTGQ